MKKLLFILLPLIAFAQTNNPNEVGLANTQIVYFTNTHDEDRARDFLFPYLYYVDENGMAQDHLMDGLLFMEGFNYSDKFLPWYKEKDLNYYLDNIFTKTKLVELATLKGGSRVGLIDKRTDFGIANKEIPINPCQMYTLTYRQITQSYIGNVPNGIKVGFRFINSQGNRIWRTSGTYNGSHSGCEGDFEYGDDLLYSNGDFYGIYYKEFDLNPIWENKTIQVVMPIDAVSVSLYFFNNQPRETTEIENNSNIYIDDIKLLDSSGVNQIIPADSNFNNSIMTTTFEQANYDGHRERRENAHFLFNERQPLLDEVLEAKTLANLNNPSLGNKTTKIILSLPSIKKEFYEGILGSTTKFKIIKFLNEIETRFNNWSNAHPNSNIELAGIYFMDENISQYKWNYAAGFLTDIKAIINSKGWEFYGVPHAAGWSLGCYTANSAYLYSSLSTFDMIWQQPNSFFKKSDGSGGTIFVDRGVIEAIIPTINNNNFGIEIESRILNIAEGEPYGRINDYFDYGNKYGYVNSSRMHYDDAGAYYVNSKSDDPLFRQDYDNLYNFVQEGRQGKIINKGFEHLDSNGKFYNWQFSSLSSVMENVISNSLNNRGILSVTNTNSQIDSDIVPLEANESYTFRLQTRETPNDFKSNSGLIAFKFYNKSGNLINPSSISGLTYSSQLGAWYKYVHPTLNVYNTEDITFTTPSNIVTTRFFIKRWGTNSTILWKNLKIINNATGELMPELFYGYQSNLLKPENKISNGKYSLKLNKDRSVLSRKRIPVTTDIDYQISVSAKELLPILTENKHDKALIGIECFDNNGNPLGNVISELAHSSSLGMNYFYIYTVNQVWNSHTATFSFPSNVASIQIYVRNWEYNNSILIDNLELTTNLVDNSRTVGENILAKESWGESFPLTVSIDKPVFYNELINVENADGFNFSVLTKKMGSDNLKSLLSIEYFDDNHTILESWNNPMGLSWSQPYKLWYSYFEGINDDDCNLANWYLNKWTTKEKTFSVHPDAKWMRLSFQNFSSKDVKFLNPILEIILSRPSPNPKSDNSDSLLTNTRQSNVNEKTSNSFIYPNPADNQVTIFLNNHSQSSNAKLIVYNIHGRLILTKEKLSQNYSVDVSNYSSGVYLFEIISNNQTSTHKIIVR